MKALTTAQKETRKSAVGFFLNLAGALFIIYFTGMRTWEHWLYLVWCVVCIIGCAYYVQHDIKKSVREGGEDAS